MSPETEPQVGHTSVVYFHGIGEQRRHEELGRLIDSLDTWIHDRREASERNVVDGLSRIRARFEPSRDERLEDDVVYVRVNRRRQRDGVDHYDTVRFYEVFWAPTTAQGTSSREVLTWLLSHTWTPIRMLATPWRSRQRHHRSVLLAQLRARSGSEQPSPEDVSKLIKEYSGFEGPEARRRFPRGRFGEFVAFLRQRFEKKPETAKRLIELSRSWRRHFVLRELRVFAVLTSLLLTVSLALFVLAGALLALLRFVARTGLPGLLEGSGLEAYAAKIEPTTGNVILLIVALLVLVGAGRFLRSYVGDVQFWATYRETDEKHETRAEILAHGAMLLRHVLKDPKCARVCVVAHSLGTAIAMECLLALGRHNRARDPAAPIRGPLDLQKLHHFVTLGSPVDKIHYFFESHRSNYHRYVRVADDVRGDLAHAPFAKNRKPHLHWINVWDRADLISGPLESPTSGRTPALRVDNVEISSFLFPRPVASHSAYFRNRTTLRILDRVIFDAAYDYTNPPRDEGGRPQFDALVVGPGAGRRLTAWLQGIALALPWLMFLTLALILFGAPPWTAYVGLSLALACAAALGAASGSTRKDEKWLGVAEQGDP